MSLFNPWVILGIIMAVLSAAGSGYYKGKHDENTRQQVEIAALNAKARDTEQRMGEVAQTYGETLRKANNVAKVKEDKLRADIATGKRKLFIPVQAPDCPVSTTADAPVTDGDNSGETRAELSGQVSESLIAIAAEGDAAIRKLNQCIQTYETLKGMK
jgi:hypothetical protein